MNRNEKKVLKMEGKRIVKERVDEIVSALPDVSKMDKATLCYTVLRCFDRVSDLKNSHKVSLNTIYRSIADALGYETKESVGRIVAAYNLHLSGESPAHDKALGSYYRTWELVFSEISGKQTWQEFFKVAS